MRPILYKNRVLICSFSQNVSIYFCKRGKKYVTFLVTPSYYKVMTFARYQEQFEDFKKRVYILSKYGTCTYTDEGWSLICYYYDMCK